MPESFRVLASLFEDDRTIIGDDEKDAMLCLEKHFSKAPASFPVFADASEVWGEMCPFDCTTEFDTVVETCRKSRTAATKAIFHAALVVSDIKRYREFLRELLPSALSSCEDCSARVKLRPILRKLLYHTAPSTPEADPSQGEITGSEAAKLITFFSDLLEDGRLLSEMNYKIDLIDTLYDWVTWGLEDREAGQWEVYHASLLIQTSAGTMFAKSVQRYEAKLLNEERAKEDLDSSFVGAPGFSLERWVFWMQRLKDIRKAWDMTPIGPGLRSVPYYAKEAYRAMEDAEERAVSGLLERP